MQIKIPFRFISMSLAFLYLIMPIIFCYPIRVVLGLPQAYWVDFSLGAVYSVVVFLLFIFMPKVIIIDTCRTQNFDRSCAFLILIITAYFIFVGMNLDTFFYSDKVAAHLAYEELNEQYHLRAAYNIGLVFVVLSVYSNGFRGYHLFLFLIPVVFEAIYSKHNYATHVLIYLFCGCGIRTKVKRVLYFSFFQ